MPKTRVLPKVPRVPALRQAGHNACNAPPGDVRASSFGARRAMRSGYELDDLIAELLPVAEATTAQLDGLSGTDFDRELSKILATTDVVLGLYPDAEKPNGMGFQLIKGARIMMLVLARKLPVITRCNNTLGLPGRLASRIQPNHPSDSLEGILLATLEGLTFGCGDDSVVSLPTFHWRS